MTREEAIEQLKWYFEYDNGLSADKETVEAYKMAIKALSAEPCEDAISFPKGTLKKRGKGYVVYNPEWLKENWQTELKVMGVECEDAISRADTIEWLKKVTVTDGITFETGFKQILTDIQNMPSVTAEDGALGTSYNSRRRGCAVMQ